MAYGQKSLWIHGTHGGHGIFWELLRKKSLGEIFFKMLLRKKYCGFAVYLQIKSLTKIIDQNALFLRVLP